MAQRALPAGAVRRRTAFGLLDADGWTWAFVKALFWFLLVLFLLGYVPDRLYYFTVSPTIDLGYNAISPINLCPAENRGLPCPAPAGAVVPWETSPDELALPEPLAGAGTFTSGEDLYLVGGRTADGSTPSVLATTVMDGNFAGGWTEGPALPEPRSDAAVVNLAGTPYVIGGLDAGGAPTASVLRGIVEEGLLTGWEAVDELALPEPLADLSGVATVDGVWLFGGRDTAGTPTNAVYHAGFDTAIPPQLEPWQEVGELPLPEARADARAVLVGNFIYVLGGEGPQGPSNSVFFLALTTEGEPQVDPATDRPFGWGVPAGAAAQFALPEPRAGHASFTNAGAIYVLGGIDAEGASQSTAYWAVPDNLRGTIPEWRQLSVTDLPDARVDAAGVAIGGTAFVIGGETAEDPTATSVRARLAPDLPFFRLGLFGATVPAMGIEGEIGQQLGYLMAAGVGTTNFVILILIGFAYSHRRGTMRFIERISRGRYRAPVDEEYGP